MNDFLPTPNCCEYQSHFNILRNFPQLLQKKIVTLSSDLPYFFIHMFIKALITSYYNYLLMCLGQNIPHRGRFLFSFVFPKLKCCL